MFLSLPVFGGNNVAGLLNCKDIEMEYDLSSKFTRWLLNELHFSDV